MIQLFKLLVFIIAVLLTTITMAEGAFEYGMNAFQKGNYPTAIRLWTPLAEAGHAIAQYNLGVMYYEGYGIVQDYSKAAEWFLKSANQGHSEAQRNLGVMYYEGNWVEKNDVQAYMWFDIAISNGNSQAYQNRAMLAARMTPFQISEAQNLIRMWRSKQHKNVIHYK